MRILIYGAGVIGCLYVTEKSNCKTKYQRIAEREEFDKF